MSNRTAAILVLALLSASGLGAQAVPQTDSAVVVLLGTGLPRPNPKASGPATAVVVGSRVFLFDAGSGVERQLAAAGLPINGVTAVFITHLHSDHTLGYPDLIITSWIMGRTRPLDAFGPPGLARMTDHILAAYSEDIAIRSAGLEHEVVVTPQVRVREIRPGVVYDSAGVRITAILVAHGSWPVAFGYRIDAPGRSIVISGDTRPVAALEKASAGVDVLVHEAYSSDNLKPENRPGGADWPTYMHAFHTSDVELGGIAARARPKLLVLTHLGLRGTDSVLIAGVRRGGFTGEVAVGKDLQRY